MIRLPGVKRCGPIGVDMGTRSVKLAQFTADGESIADVARWDLPVSEKKGRSKLNPAHVTEAIQSAMAGGSFVGRDAVLCLTDRQLFLQNIRVPKVEGVDLDRLMTHEAAGRLPFPVEESEIRCLDAADVRQGGAALREVILVACHRPDLEAALSVVVEAGLRPVAVDIEPLALLRCGAAQFRRDADKNSRSMFVHIGYGRTLAVIAENDHALFVKYIELGGRHLDLAVARQLEMSLPEAAALRRNNGDRRADQQDPEVARSVGEAVRPVMEQLSNELSMCVRYHSVTFRGCPLTRLVFSGGEASQALLDAFGPRLDVKCEISNPFRQFAKAPQNGRATQWDVAAGLALRMPHTRQDSKPARLHA